MQEGNGQTRVIELHTRTYVLPKGMLLFVRGTTKSPQEKLKMREPRILN